MPGALTMMAQSVLNFAPSQVYCVTVVNLALAFDGFLPRSNSTNVDIIRRGPPRLVKTHNLEPTKMQPSGVLAAAARSTPIATAVAPN